MIINCDCKTDSSKYMDAEYGQNKRVGNPTSKAGVVRCCSCGKDKVISTPEKKGKK